ncbi:lipopolysaccharide biosynthesis protein [Flavobacterium sedimenticola]|uniref:Lipopolysaccharide biosynthesis protein n=1 Tax=Flavobacterium sedimenticola TaxID=3043286 RepID=A0ABT6XRU8_9FLAO|nr:oligosaccharide flippase family protein [Flavobacterium sedimenticola]MDI9257707.1 lipopolysaccharide biosynthesis protein [Flavobacterium sedimenticola]
MIKTLVGKIKPENKSFVALTFSNLFSNVVAIISGIIIARWVLPEEFGLFNALSIFTSYIILIQLGIPSGLSREFPFYYGKSDEKYAEELAATAKYFMLALSFGILLLGVIAGIVFSVRGEYEYAIGSLVVGLTSAQTFFTTKFLKVLYRSDNHFLTLSKVTMINTIASLVTIFLVYEYSYYGLCLRALLLVFVDWYFTDKWKPLDVKSNFSWKNFKELSRVGMPIYFVANVYSLWPTFQRTIILSTLGAKGLGVYALANIVQNMLSTFNGVVSSTSFPKMSLAYGQGKNINQIIRIPLRLALISFLIYFFILIVGWPLLPKVVDFVLPNYVEGVEAAQWMLLVALVSSFAVFSNIYMVVKKNHHRLISYFIGITVWLLFIIFNRVDSIQDLVVFSKALFYGYLAVNICDGCFYYYYLKANRFTS